MRRKPAPGGDGPATARPGPRGPPGLRNETDYGRGRARAAADPHAPHDDPTAGGRHLDRRVAGEHRTAAGEDMAEEHHPAETERGGTRHGAWLAPSAGS